MASGEGTSMADLTDMAKANARGASPRDVARGQKIADELGVDLKTGKPLEAADDRTPEKIESDRLAIEAQKKQNQLLDQQIEAGRKPDATPAEKESAALAQAVKDGTITQEQADERKKQKLLGKPPGLYDTWAEYEAKTGTDADGNGEIATPEEAAAAAPSEGKSKKLPTVTDEASYNALKSGQKYIHNGKEYTKK
jgi:hypothetical protein